MRLLPDTHIFLWYITADARLPAPLSALIRDPAHEVFLSVVSLWEVIIKHQLGKLPLPASPETYLPRQRERHQIRSLGLEEADVAALGQLPPLHKDPFDRMLIAQAIRRNLTIATLDAAIRTYPATFAPVA